MRRTRSPALPAALAPVLLLVPPALVRAHRPGTQVNVSGAGLTAPAKRRANAAKFLEFLSSAEAQQLFQAAATRLADRAGYR